SPIARQASPSGSAPRRMRSTLYCAPVSPSDLISCSACNPSASAAFRIEMNTRSSKGSGREGLLFKAIAMEDSRCHDYCQEEIIMPAGTARSFAGTMLFVLRFAAALLYSQQPRTRPPRPSTTGRTLHRVRTTFDGKVAISNDHRTH